MTFPCPIFYVKMESRSQGLVSVEKLTETYHTLEHSTPTQCSKTHTKNDTPTQPSRIKQTGALTANWIYPEYWYEQQRNEDRAMGKWSYDGVQLQTVANVCYNSKHTGNVVGASNAKNAVAPSISAETFVKGLACMCAVY